MSDRAHKPVPLDEAVPVAVTHEEKTVEMPAFEVPEEVPTDRDTVPVASSLQKLLRHEMLRHESATDDAAPRKPKTSR
jgi:hypothetical protein